MFPPFLGDHVRPPRGHPHPVQCEVFHHAAAHHGFLCLLFQHVSERAGRAGQGHFNVRVHTVFDPNAVNQPQVYDEIIGDGIAFSGVSQYPARVKCALLVWKAFQAAAAESMEEQE